jgi:uncharacterized membrane protein
LALIGDIMSPSTLSTETTPFFANPIWANQWRIADALILVAILVLLAGVILLVDRLRSGVSTELAAIATVTIYTGGAIAITQTAIHLEALRNQAEQWFRVRHGTEAVAAFYGAAAIQSINDALGHIWSILLLGILPIAVGLMLLQARRAKPAHAYAGVIAGIAGLLGPTLALGNLHDTSNTIFTIGQLLVIAWLMALGVWLILHPDCLAAEHDTTN